MPPCRVDAIVDVDPQRSLTSDDGDNGKQTSSSSLSNDTSSVVLDNKENRHPRNRRNGEYDPILKTLYIVTTYLCFAMVGWIMIVPGGWLIGRSRFHKDYIMPFLEDQGWVFSVVPKEIVTKFEQHTLIHVTHHIPSAIWAAIIPFQLHPKFRTRNKALHRLLGYIFLVTVVLVTVGVFIILQRKLSFHHTFSDLEPQPQNRDETQHIFMGGMSLWFSYTAMQAVSIMVASGRRRREGGGVLNSSSNETMKNAQVQHQKWMYRHVASGIWIAVQRMIIIPVAIGYYQFFASNKPSRWAQREIFSASAQMAWMVSICLGEYAHHRVAMLKKSSTTTGKSKTQ